MCWWSLELTTFSKLKIKTNKLILRKLWRKLILKILPLYLSLRSGMFAVGQKKSQNILFTARNSKLKRQCHSIGKDKIKMKSCLYVVSYTKQTCFYFFTLLMLWIVSFYSLLVTTKKGFWLFLITYFVRC